MNDIRGGINDLTFRVTQKNFKIENFWHSGIQPILSQIEKLELSMTYLLVKALEFLSDFMLKYDSYCMNYLNSANSEIYSLKLLKLTLTIKSYPAIIVGVSLIEE